MRDIQWEDTGFDCEHCGGEVLKRTHSQQDEVYYQCSQCGYRWSLDGAVIRKGTGQSPYWEERDASFHPSVPNPSRRLWLLVAVLVGGTAVYFLSTRLLIILLWIPRFLPLIVVAGIFYFVWRYGKTEEWW